MIPTRHRAAARLATAALLCLAVPAAGGTLSGRVALEAGGGPAAAVWVAVTRIGELIPPDTGADTATPRWQRLVFTDAAGRFALDELAAGIYEVAAVPESLPGALAPAGPPTRVAVAPGRDRSEVELALTRQAAIQGRVRRRGAGWLVGARIDVFHHGDPAAFADARSDGEGRFTVARLAPGDRVDLVATGPEGLFARVAATPLRAGRMPLEVELPSWDSLSRRRVQVLVSVPATLGQRLEMEWRSSPEDVREGFVERVLLDRDARAALESPVGLFQVRVRELESGGRTWVAPRLVRVTPGGAPLSARVEVELAP